jgi:hypothetical protein
MGAGSYVAVGKAVDVLVAMRKELNTWVAFGVGTPTRASDLIVSFSVSGVLISVALSIKRDWVNGKNPIKVMKARPAPYQSQIGRLFSVLIAVPDELFT